MTERNFSLVEAAVIESNLGTMRGMRDALNQSGIRKVHPFQNLAGQNLAGQNLASLTEALIAAQPDLIVVDVDSPEIDGFKLIRWLRTDAAYPNPFVCILATSWQPTEALLHKLHNSGADLLLVKPTSPKQVTERIHALLESRKRFTVSADYIGPDRRKTPREGPQIPSFDAPNTLKLKAGGPWERNSAREQISNGITWVNEQKAQRDAFQIAFYVEVAGPGLATTPPDRMAFDLILKINALIEDLLKRTEEVERDPGLETTCRATQALVERVRRQPGNAVAAADTDELRTLSASLMRMVTPGRPAESMAGEVAEAAAAYHKRLEQILAAKAEAAKPAP